MCVVSMVTDAFQDRWKDKIGPQPIPFIPDDRYVIPMTPEPLPFPRLPPTAAPAVWPLAEEGVIISRKEFDRLKNELEVLKDLVKRAKDYDSRNNEPDCEVEDKIAFVKMAAKLVGLDFDEVFGK